MSGEPRELVLLDRAEKALAEATTIDEITDVRDKSEAVRATPVHFGTVTFLPRGPPPSGVSMTRALLTCDVST